MRLEDLNKNNKYAYRRPYFAPAEYLLYRDGVWVQYVQHSPVIFPPYGNADDWEESDILNPYYVEDVQIPQEVKHEEPKMIAPIIWKNPKPNVKPTRQPTRGQWVVVDGGYPARYSENVYSGEDVYPLYELKQSPIKTGLLVELLDVDDILHIVKRKITDEIELVCGTKVKITDVKATFGFKPEEVKYEQYACGTCTTEYGETFTNVEELKESYGTGTKHKLLAVHVASYEFLRISEHFGVPIGDITPKDESILAEIQQALDHPLNVADKEWVLLVGQSGSGKTEAAVEYTKSVQKQYIKLQGSAQVTVDDLIGYNSITTGEYFPSLLRDAVENGHIFILDEIDACNPNTLLVLNGLKQEYFQFPDKLVRIHPEFRLIATANTLEYSEEYLGRSPMDKATLARFYIINYEMGQIDLAIRYGLEYVKNVQDIDRLTPREVAREVRSLKIKGLNTDEGTLKKK